MISRIILAASAAGLALATPVSAQSVADGIEEWRAGDHEAAVAIWTPLADEGDAEAQFNLGQAYRLGRGVEQNKARAQALFESAARKGNLSARTHLGLMLYGDGNRTAGLRWLREAADEGEPRALLVYGTALFNGDPLERDPVTGYALVSRAAAQGLRPAQRTLTDMDGILSVAERRDGVTLAQALATGSRTLDDVLSEERPRLATADTLPVPRPTPRRAPEPEPRATPAPTPEPAPAPARTQGRSVAAVSGWTVQLGAFSRDGAAQELFSSLRSASVFEGKRALYQEVGNVTRLRVGPFANEAEADRACAAMTSRGQACFAVAP